MLVIRLQRTGRSGHAQYRFVVQDSRVSPTSGKVVTYLGSYNPHTKTTQLDVEQAKNFLKNGAQPSDRVAGLLKENGVKLPSWVKLSVKKERSVKNPEKLRKNRPAEAEKPAEEAPAKEETQTENEKPAEQLSEELQKEATPEVEQPVEEPATEVAK